jgi:hypothetical protein
MTKRWELAADHCRKLSPERTAAYVVQSALDADVLKGIPIAVFRLSRWLELPEATDDLSRFQEACRISRFVVSQSTNDQIIHTAGALLMPCTWLRADIINEGYSHKELVDRYAVSEMLLSLRLRHLGLGY